jgi:predicted metal-dependent phosphoesterase TrpH
MDNIDLHPHSRCSDGTITPRQVVGLAKRNGLRAVALTDHDTVAGVGEALAAGEEVGVEVVAGVEISAACSAGSMHILGYYLSPTPPPWLSTTLMSCPSFWQDSRKWALREWRFCLPTTPGR